MASWHHGIMASSQNATDGSSREMAYSTHALDLMAAAPHASPRPMTALVQPGQPGQPLSRSAVLSTQANAGFVSRSFTSPLSIKHITAQAPWWILRLQRIFILGVTDIDISRASRAKLLPFGGGYAMSIRDRWRVYGQTSCLKS